MKIIDHPECQTLVIGAIIGDCIGQPYEFPKSKRIRHKNFPLFLPGSRFTDDTVMTVALMKALIDEKKIGEADYGNHFKEFAVKYPDAGYGGRFKQWTKGELLGDSFGNGAAMRISPAGYLLSESLESLLCVATNITACSHNTDYAIKTAQAVARGIRRGLLGFDMSDIKKSIEDILGDKIFRPSEYDICYNLLKNSFSASFPSVHQAIACFLVSESVEDAIREAVACGQDSDTQAAIAASLALAYYKELPAEIIKGMPDLPDEFIQIIAKFSQAYNVPKIKLV